MSFRPVFLSVQLFVDDRLDALLREGRVLVKQPVPHEHEVQLPMLLPEYASAGPRAQRLRAPAAQMAYHRWSTAVSGKDGAASGSGPSPRCFRNRLPSPDSPHLLSPLN